MTATNTETPAGKMPAYRRRLAAAGAQEVLFQLPKEIIALIDSLKHSQGLRSRSQALMQLIEQGRQPPDRISS